MPYLVAGDETSPAMILIHGFGGCIGHWRNNVEALATQYRVYVIDLLGFGAAPKPQETYSFELWGQQVVEFCREIVGGDAALVGNSIGAVVAMQAAVMVPEMTRSLVAINCSLRLLHERRREQLSVPTNGSGPPWCSLCFSIVPWVKFFLPAGGDNGDRSVTFSSKLTIVTK